MESSISLYELNNRIRKDLNNSFPDHYWVVAEISELKVNKSGHGYLELVEKDAGEVNVKAKARATIWVSTFGMLKSYFESVTHKSFEAGIKVLVKCRIEFHEVYGLSLNILDIDPTYTVGELARKREETIKRLEEEGVIMMNRELPLSPVPQKIAVISSESAAGYQDFIRHLDDNDFGVKYYHKLFPAYMQGAEAEKSVIKALNKIFDYESFFEVVVIIRGGGSQADLTCFDSYKLAYYITQFPLPVITGIGHEKDESVVDIVANTYLKTPTAVADFLLQKASLLLEQLTESQHRTIKVTKALVQHHKLNLTNTTNLVTRGIKHLISTEANNLIGYSGKLRIFLSTFLKDSYVRLAGSGQQMLQTVKHFVNKKADALANIEQTIPNQLSKVLHLQKVRIKTLAKTNQLLDPERVLKRGFSITTAKGKIVKKATDLEKGDLIKTDYFRGQSISKIESTE